MFEQVLELLVEQEALEELELQVEQVALVALDQLVVLEALEVTI